MIRTTAVGPVAVAASLLASPSAFAGLTINAPIDVIGNLTAADFTSHGYGTNSYKDWGNEPSVTVNPTNPTQILVSSFAYGACHHRGGRVLLIERRD